MWSFVLQILDALSTGMKKVTSDGTKYAYDDEEWITYDDEETVKIKVKSLNFIIRNLMFQNQYSVSG